MRKANILPIAVMAFALVGFLFVLDYSISDGKWPWSTEKTTTNTTANTSGNVNAEVNSNTSSNTNTVSNTNTTTDSTAGWKTYTNPTYGYSIKYPKDYSTSDGTLGNNIERGQLNGKPYYRVSVAVYTSPITGGREGQDIYTWAKKGFPNDANVESSHANPKKVTLGSITYLYTDGDLGSTPVPEYMVFHDNKLFVLTDYRAIDKTVSTNITIITSFSFLSPTADWKTYTNTAYGYTLQYPKTYTATGSANHFKLDLEDYENGNVAHLNIYVADGINDDEFGQSSDGLAVIDWINSARTGFPTSKYMENKRITTINGKEFVTFDYDLGGSGGSVLYFYVKGKVVYIIHDWPGGAGNPNFNPLAKGRILPTFSFTK